ncbi:MAG: phosphoglucomutase/phosphomannomutase family protein [bacterium]|nr:phosphoglucomutase/phosphomannomutase family protein [bacterium]
MVNIKFGTDGWRGVIAKDFTFENLERVAMGFAGYLKKNKKSKVVIGYDARFFSDKFARRFAEVLSQSGIKCYLSKKIIPTPVLSFGVVKTGADAGVMITASHNPPEYNGIKFKSGAGGSVTKEVTNEIEKNIAGVKEPFIENADLQKTAFIEEIDITTDYFKHIYRNIDIDMISRKKFRIVFESMGGAGLGYMEKILNKGEVINITDKYDPLFKGRHPEPLPENVREAIETVVEKKADLGVVTDGDADRIAFIDSKGNFISSQKILGYLLLHLIKNKGYNKGVGRTFAASSLLEKICAKYKLKLFTKPIGFKYIADLMEKGDIAFGGEESGGIGYEPHLLERDGIFIALMTLEMMAKENKSLVQIIRDMEKEFGCYYYDRVDLRISAKQINKFRERLPKLEPKTIAGLKVVKVDTLDGKKFLLEKDSWLLMRPSGTEPLVRVYAESSLKGKVSELLKAGTKFVLG